MLVFLPGDSSNILSSVGTFEMKMKLQLHYYYHSKRGSKHAKLTNHLDKSMAYLGVHRRVHNVALRHLFVLDMVADPMSLFPSTGRL